MIKNRYGIIGAGSFGIALANLIRENGEVMIYSRRLEAVEEVRKKGRLNGNELGDGISATNDEKELAEFADVIIPVVESKGFRMTIRSFSPHLTENHIVIHGTKGVDVGIEPEDPLADYSEPLGRAGVRTMSEVILEESKVKKVGCLAGPNLAREISSGLPAGTVIGSLHDEVFEAGRNALQNPKFKVFYSRDLKGVELAGVLKNIIAIGSGLVSGLELGENARALLITKGWGDMMRVAKLFGSDLRAFMGLAGIGDLIATCSSPLSRNYTVGYRLAQGEKLAAIVEDMEEIAEGINTTRIAAALVKQYKLHCPIISGFHGILFEEVPISEAIDRLMNFPYSVDVDFL